MIEILNLNEVEKQGIEGVDTLGIILMMEYHNKTFIYIHFKNFVTDRVLFSIHSQSMTTVLLLLLLLLLITLGDSKALLDCDTACKTNGMEKSSRDLLSPILSL